MFSRVFAAVFGVWFAAGALRADRSGLALLVVLALLAAYRGGRWRRPASAIARAEARSTAAVQVNVGQGYSPAGPRSAPALEPTSRVIELDRQELSAQIAGELGDGEVNEAYVDWLAGELERSASSETRDP